MTFASMIKTTAPPYISFEYREVNTVIHSK